MDVSDFDFELPPELIAQEPASDRSAARLLCVDRASGSIAHSRVAALPEHLRAGDLVRAAGRLISERPGPEKTTHEQRPPSRLVAAALEAARAGHVGTNTVAALLGRADDDTLFDEVMYPDVRTRSQ